MGRRVVLLDGGEEGGERGKVREDVLGELRRLLEDCWLCIGVGSFGRTGAVVGGGGIKSSRELEILPALLVWLVEELGARAFLPLSFLPPPNRLNMASSSLVFFLSLSFLEALLSLSETLCFLECSLLRALSGAWD